MKRLILAAMVALLPVGLPAQEIGNALVRAGWLIVADQIPAPVRYLLPDDILPPDDGGMGERLDALGRDLGARLDRLATAEDVSQAIAAGLAAQDLIRANREIAAIRLRLAACPEGDKACAADLAREGVALVRIASEAAVQPPVPEVVVLVLLAAETHGQILDRQGVTGAARAAELARYRVFFANLADAGPGSAYGRAMETARLRLAALLGQLPEAVMLDPEGASVAQMMAEGLRGGFEALMGAAIHAALGDGRVGYLDTIPEGDALHYAFGCVVRHVPRLGVMEPDIDLDGYWRLVDAKLPPREPIEGRAALTFLTLGIENIGHAPRAVARVVEASGPDGPEMVLPLTPDQSDLILAPVPPYAQVGGRTTWGLLIEALTRPGDTACVTADAFDLNPDEGLDLLVAEVERRMAAMVPIYEQVDALSEGRALAEGYLAALGGS